jgi:hypothetical protein
MTFFSFAVDVIGELAGIVDVSACHRCQPSAPSSVRLT